MSERAVKIIEIGEVCPHENADRLCVVPIGGWSCVVGKDQFKAGSRAIYIEPDYVVPLDRPEFAFLRKEGSDETAYHLKAIRLRGIVSFGLLIPVPEELAGRQVGDNVMEELGITRFDANGPATYVTKFDVQDLRKFEDIFKPGEQVAVTEKIHGRSARFCWLDGALYVGSRADWLKLEGESLWTRALTNTPSVEDWCRWHEGYVLYGEVYGGSAQELKYGLREPAFIAFATLAHGNWIDWKQFCDWCDDCEVPHAPTLYEGPFDRDLIAGLGEQDSKVPTAPAGHMMEGVVIAPTVERRDDRIGRVCLKLISNRYWLS